MKFWVTESCYDTHNASKQPTANEHHESELEPNQRHRFNDKGTPSLRRLPPGFCSSGLRFAAGQLTSRSTCRASAKPEVHRPHQLDSGRGSQAPKLGEQQQATDHRVGASTKVKQTAERVTDTEVGARWPWQQPSSGWNPQRTVTPLWRRRVIANTWPENGVNLQSRTTRWLCSLINRERRKTEINKWWIDLNSTDDNRGNEYV